MGGGTVLPKVKVSKDTTARDKDVVDHARKKAEIAAINAKQGNSVLSDALDGETHGKKLSDMPSMQRIKETREELDQFDFELLQK
jgi:hypothetical protein